MHKHEDSPSELKPFGIEYLQEIPAPEEVSGQNAGSCCNTFMSELRDGLDIGSMTCEGYDNPCA